jgi:hypothetical protein
MRAGIRRFLETTLDPHVKSGCRIPTWPPFQVTLTGGIAMRFEALKVGDLARRTGLTVRTSHHYDGIGLLKPSLHTEAGYRLYTAGHIDTHLAPLGLKAEPWPGSPGTQVENLARSGPRERLGQERPDGLESSA